MDAREDVLKEALKEGIRVMARELGLEGAEDRLKARIQDPWMREQCLKAYDEVKRGIK